MAALRADARRGHLAAGGRARERGGRSSSCAIARWRRASTWPRPLATGSGRARALRALGRLPPAVRPPARTVRRQRVDLSRAGLGRGRDRGHRAARLRRPPAAGHRERLRARPLQRRHRRDRRRAPASAPTAAFERGGELLRFSPLRLGAVETVYAMTIHKSQGSQFDTAAVLLPPDELAHPHPRAALHRGHARPHRADPGRNRGGGAARGGAAGGAGLGTAGATPYSPLLRFAPWGRTWSWGSSVPSRCAPTACRLRWVARVSEPCSPCWRSTRIRSYRSTGSSTTSGESTPPATAVHTRPRVRVAAAPRDVDGRRAAAHPPARATCSSSAWTSSMPTASSGSTTPPARRWPPDAPRMRWRCSREAHALWRGHAAGRLHLRAVRAGCDRPPRGASAQRARGADRRSARRRAVMSRWSRSSRFSSASTRSASGFEVS